MNLTKRNFFKAGAGLAAWLVSGARPGQAQTEKPSTHILIQNSPLAGFQYHQGKKVWPRLRTGQPLTLQREADNTYDAKAVMVLWNGKKLGYVPRADNVAVSQMLDRGIPLQARIVELADSPNPWKRIRMEIHMETSRKQA